MSDDVNTTAATAATTETTVSKTVTSISYISEFFSAMSHGAAIVYHKILAIDDDVLNWTHDNVAIQPMIDEAVSFGTLFLTAHGIPVAAVEVAAAAVMSALKSMAANDATVASYVPVPVKSL